MARDYKKRAQPRGRSGSQLSSVAWWKWLLVVMLITGFVLFLINLSDSTSDQVVSDQDSKTIAISKSRQQSPQKPEKQVIEPAEPQFDFYTILPESEVVVPDYEVKTRAREELVGKAKTARYVMQAGAFRNYKEADRLRARLALLGIESRVEKAGVWNRVKIGPYSRMSSVDRVKSRLKQNGIDVIVTEING